VHGKVDYLPWREVARLVCAPVIEEIIEFLVQRDDAAPAAGR
jgi:hypothetical protein